MFYMTTTMNLGMSFREVILLRIYQMVGVAFLFVPIQTMCYVGIPPGKNNNVSGMTNLARNMGGSIGISLVMTLLARRGQFHQNRLAAHTSTYDPAFQLRRFQHGEIVPIRRIRRCARHANGL